MQKLHVFATLVDENDRPLSNRAVSLQFFNIATGNWRALATLRSNTRGQIAHLRNFSSPSSAPMIRLTEPGAPAVRVLALGGIARYDKSSKTLFVDFGTIERLDDQAFVQTSLISQLARQRHTVAGAPNRPSFSNALAMRVVTSSQPVAPAVMARATVAPAVATGARPTATAEVVARPTVDSAEQIKVLNAHIATFGAREISLNRQIQVKDDAIRQKETRIQTLETQSAEEKRLRLAAEGREATLQTQLGKQVSVNELTSNIGQQVKSAQDQMSASATPYRMGKVEVNLKALVGDQGRKLTLPDAADLSKAGTGAALADVHLEFLPEQRASAEGLAGVVPDVSDLTESAARRLLRAAGLGMEAAYTSVGPDAAGLIGRAVKQSPAQGSALERGRSVLVVFASA